MRPDIGVLLDWVMSLTHADPPDDPEALRGWALALQAELAVRDDRIAALEGELKTDKLVIEKLEVELATLKRGRFGRSSEKLDRRIDQLELLIGEFQESSSKNVARSDVLRSEPGRVRQRQMAVVWVDSRMPGHKVARPRGIEGVEMLLNQEIRHRRRQLQAHC